MIACSLDREIKEKAAAKYDPLQEKEAREYTEAVSGTPFPSTSFHESLKDGIILCTMLNNMQLTDPIKISLSKSPFKQMENIATFLHRIDQLGVPAHDRFMTIDLWEAKNLGQVVNCIFSVSRHATRKGFHGPVIGPKLVEQKKARCWTMDQLRDAQNVPSKLMSFSTNVSSSIGYRQVGYRT
ncbi:Muscle-specific protein 20 [Podochytrium sp. JEL0797]|nr:Muscle-specific protein 20 [Podochytrium sp. JEL0797]